MAIKKIMFENEVLEVGEINEKYNPTAVKGIEEIRPLWTLWISLILWFFQNPEIFLISFENGKQLKLINPKNVIVESEHNNEDTINFNIILAIITLIILFVVYSIIMKLR
ncbi:hypothetical protein LDK25_06995 [Fusobacterium nucleatum]|jgi:hypothetical protein|uniref:hypothetical protein n=1 Tax=Fusobacterium nucleatum TaxID=851 RepID=UPI0030ED782B